MTEVPIQISGVLYDKTARTQQSVVLMGKASIMGLSVGGGPIVPPEEGGGGEPPVIWPSPGHPAHPIVLPPDQPPIEGGGPPPKPTFPIWGPPGVEFPPGEGYPPVAGHPLPPDGAPDPIPNWEAKIFWTPVTGWGVGVFPTGALVPTPSKK